VRGAGEPDRMLINKQINQQMTGTLALLALDPLHTIMQGTVTDITVTVALTMTK
jgi:hypothetical protein